MTPASLLDFCRVALISLVIFAGLPYLAAGPGKRTLCTEWPNRLAGAFVRVSLFFEVTIIVLRLLRLCLPGMVTVSYVVWLILCALWGYRRQLQNVKLLPGVAFLKLLCHFGAGGSVWRGRAGLLLPRRVSMPALFFGLLTLVILLHRAAYPLQNLRFTRMDSYSRVL